MKWSCDNCGAKYAMPAGALAGSLSLTIRCKRCEQEMSVRLDLRPTPEPERSWLSRAWGRLSGETELFAGAAERDAERARAPSPAQREFIGLLVLGPSETPATLEAALAAGVTIDWHSDIDEVLVTLGEVAEQLGVAPLWTDEEASRWESTEVLFTWQLVDHLVARFEAAGLAAFDASSLGDGYQLLFVRRQDFERAAALATRIDATGDLRPYRKRKFAEEPASEPQA